MQDYRQLDVWQVGMELAENVYDVTRQFPPEEKFGLTSQMRRTAISVVSNIAEGNARGSTQDYIRFLRISRGAAAELDTQLLLSQRLGYLQEPDDIMCLVQRIRRMLQGLLRSLEERANNTS